MGLKPVEMQIALPRTADAGQQQQNLIQKPLSDQHELAQAALKQSEKTLTRTEKTENAEQNAIRGQGQDGKGKGTDRERKRGQSKKGERKADTRAHPYKGRHIDLSL